MHCVRRTEPELSNIYHRRPRARPPPTD
jgi:hypothetical protein